MKKSVARALLKLARRLDPPIGTVTYNITAHDTEAAFLEAKRQQRGYM